MGDNMGGRENTRDRSGMENRERGNEMMMKGLGEYEIMGAGGKPESRFQIVEKRGIEIKIGRDDDKFLYELKVPLKITGDIAYAVGADTGKTISIGLETGEMKMEKMKMKGDKGSGQGEGQEGDAMSAGTGMGGGMGGRQRGGGGGRPGGGGGMMEKSSPLSMWFKVQLSSGK
jgi:hypothetical protein